MRETKKKTPLIVDTMFRQQHLRALTSLGPKFQNLRTTLSGKKVIGSKKERKIKKKTPFIVAITFCLQCPKGRA